jgi:23S rRNA U2552 (ribose-2'-O)-methylase RlmE/FtsJ
MINIVYDIKVYRQTLKDIIKEDDVVVELGCHVGNSTRIISQLAPHGKIIALDKGTESREKLDELKKEVKTPIEFINADVRLHETLEEVGQKVDEWGGCDVLSVDLGGGYHPDTTFKVFYIWSSTLKPRDTIIRNIVEYINTYSFFEAAYVFS